MSDTSILRETRRGWFERVPSRVLGAIRSSLLEALDAITWGCIEITDELGHRTLGARGNPGPQVSVQVHDLDMYAYTGLGGSTGAGQSYFLDLWDTDDLVGLVRILVHNRDTLDAMDSGLAVVGRPFYAWFHRQRQNSLRGSRENISAHYDLGNDFFEHMLDPTMMYSAGIYPARDASLETAQLHKLDVICDKLVLSPEVHLLEIGTGWGGLAVHAAKRSGCRVTTTTISKEQHAFATERVKREGLEDRVTVLFEDYRELTGTFDRLVSIEMVEAVGDAWFDTYFRTVDARLADDGLALIQAITIEDQRYEQYRSSVDFIKRYVFPGGCLPSVAVMSDCVRRCTDMRVRHVEDIGDHYARTLADWQQRCDAHADTLEALGYDRTFMRLWRFYLAYCQGGFMERSIGDVQLLLEKPQSRAPTPVTGAPGRLVP